MPPGLVRRELFEAALGHRVEAFVVDQPDARRDAPLAAAPLEAVDEAAPLR